MAKGAKGWLTPDQAPAGFVRRTVSIPDSPAFIQAVNGALYELALSYNWQADGFMTPEQCQEFMQTMWLDYLESKPMLPKNYIHGLTVRTVNQSATGIVYVSAGECRDATDEHDLTNGAEVEIAWPSSARTANTWYKVIYSMLGTLPAPRIEAASYVPVAYERHIGWVRTFTDSTNVVRQSTVGNFNSRLVVYQNNQPPALTGNVFAWLSNPAAGTYNTIDLASYVPPDCPLANVVIRSDFPSDAVTIRWREYGRTFGGVPTVKSFPAGSSALSDEARVAIPIRSQKFDLYASATLAAGWLSGWVESYVHEV